jgi:hypothetical protein
MATIKPGKAVANGDQNQARLGVAVGRCGFVVEEALEKMTHEQRRTGCAGAARRRRARPARSARAAAGSDMVKRRWKFVRHGLSASPQPSAAQGARVLLLNQLRKDAFKIGKAHQPGEIGGRSVGQDPALCNDDDAVADLLDDFKHMRDVEDRFAFCGEQLKQIFEQAAGDNIEAGERLVEDEQFGIVQQGRGDEHALAHSLGVSGDGRVLPGLEVQGA